MHQIALSCLINIEKSTISNALYDLNKQHSNHTLLQARRQTH